MSDENKIAIDTARQDEQIRTLFERQKEMSYEIKENKMIAVSVERLAISVESLAGDLKDVKEDVKDVKTEVAAILKEPSTAWKNLKAAVVGAVATGGVGAIVAAVLSVLHSMG